MLLHHRSAGAAARVAGLVLLYLAAEILGLGLTHQPGGIAIFWPANALLLGGLLRLPARQRPPAVAAAGLAAMAARLPYGDPRLLAAGLAAANMLEVLCGYWLAGRLAGRPFALDGLRPLLALLAVSAITPAAGATLAAATFDLILPVHAPNLGLDWWCSDAVGMVLFLPLMLGFDPRPAVRLIRGPRDPRLVKTALELAAAFGLLLAILLLVLATRRYGLPGLFVPVLLWSALRLGVWPTAAMAAAVCVAAVLATVQSAWPLPFAARPKKTPVRLGQSVGFEHFPCWGNFALSGQRPRDGSPTKKAGAGSPRPDARWRWGSRCPLPLSCG